MYERKLLEPLALHSCAVRESDGTSSTGFPTFQCPLTDLLVVQLLMGRVPDMGRVIASKLDVLALSNTSLVQCDSSQLAAFHGITDLTQVPSLFSSMHVD